MRSILDQRQFDQGLRISAACDALQLGPEVAEAARLWPAYRDGTLTPERIADRHGRHVAEILDAVAEMSGRERTRGADADDEGLRKFLLAIAGDPRAVVLRLVIHLDALQTCVADAAPALARAARDIWAPLANRLGAWPLKWELEDQAFRVFQPDVYRRVAGWVHQRRDERERMVTDTVDRLRAALEADGIEGAEVAGRPKHLYSIWRKMNARRVGFERLCDVHALRVIVGDVPTCYAALGVVHGMWRQVPDEFDDYIANPKPNGYRSLHTAVTGPGGLPLEVQVRTQAMHDAAEQGFASHWRYKEGTRYDASYERRLAWLRHLVAPGDDPDTSLLERMRGRLLDERVYVLTPQGRIIDLPVGATVLDFAYYVHTGLGHRCRGARVNGKMRPLTTTVATGDQVEILTTRTGQPSRDWLLEKAGYLRTPRARSKVRAWFRRVKGSSPTARVAATSALPPTPRRGTDLTPRQPKIRSDLTPITIDGIDGLMTQLARCCRPLPGDPIGGYLTRGRGVTVHRADCAALQRLKTEAPDRIVTVAWPRDAVATRWPAKVRVAANDRAGLLADITGALSADKLPIRAVEAGVDRARGLARVDLAVDVGDSAELKRVLARVARVRGVISARRV